MEAFDALQVMLKRIYLFKANLTFRSCDDGGWQGFQKEKNAGGMNELLELQKFTP